MAPVFFITPFGQQFQFLIQKEFHFKLLTKIEMLVSFTDAAVAIILAFLGFGVFSLIWGKLASASLRVLLLFCWSQRHWRPRWHFKRHDLKGFVSFGLYQMGEKTVNYINSNLDYLLIGYLLGAKSLGYYTLAYNLIIKPTIMINPIVTKVAFPVFSKLQNDINKLKRGYLKVLQLLSFVNFPLMVGLAVVAPVAVPIVFGKQWLPSIVLIQILTIVGLLRSTGNPVGSLLLAKGRADLGFKWNVALMATQIPGLYFGAKYGGTVGVAIAFSILMGIYAIVSYPILIRTILGPCLGEYVSSMWPSLWISLLMGGVIFCVGIFLQNLPQKLLFIIQILGGIIIFIGLMICCQRKLVFEIKDILLKRTIS